MIEGRMKGEGGREGGVGGREEGAGGAGVGGRGDGKVRRGTRRGGTPSMVKAGRLHHSYMARKAAP